MDALDDIRTRTLAAIDASADPAALDAVRVAALGKKGAAQGPQPLSRQNHAPRKGASAGGSSSSS